MEYQTGKWERRCRRRRNNGTNDSAIAFIREDEVPRICHHGYTIMQEYPRTCFITIIEGVRLDGRSKNEENHGTSMDADQNASRHKNMRI